MIERHYSDDSLADLLGWRGPAGDGHLSACESCTERLESFRMIAGALHEPGVWDKRPLDTRPVPSTIALLRAFAEDLSFEDAQAELHIQELLAGSRDEWAPRLSQHPEWRTAGMVRKLIAAASRAVDTMPPDALEIAGLATDVADHLDTSSADPDMVTRLRGSAWRERAYMLFCIGDCRRALSAVHRAEDEFLRCEVADYDLARLGIVKTLVLRLLERVDEAASAAATSAATFHQFHDTERMASARLAEVQVMFSRGDYASADEVLAGLDRMLAHSAFAETHARVLGNRAYCARQMGKPELVMQFCDAAASILETLDIPVEVVRVRWNAALMLGEAGRLTDAYERLSAIMGDMERLGMISESALNALSLAELLLAENRFSEVEELCRTAMQAFERGGLGYTGRALTALAYIQEAARQRTANQTLVRNVREYLRELPSSPNRLFAPPPN